MASIQVLLDTLHRFGHLGPDAPDGEVAPLLERVEALLAGGDLANATNGMGHSPLRIAVRCAKGPHFAPVYARLTRHGADPAEENTYGQTLLHEAASYGNCAAIEQLLAAGLELGKKSNLGKTPLDHARSAKYGKDAAALLGRLTKEARGAKGPKTGRGDLSRDAVLGALARVDLAGDPVFAGGSLEALTEACDAAFVDALVIASKSFVEAMADRDDPALLWGATRIVAIATTDAAKPLTIERRRKLPVFHHGDLHVAGDVDVATSLVVTGHLHVAGRLSNYEGTTICVLGDVHAKDLVTEGPMRVGGNVVVEGVAHASTNDYALHVGKTLRAALLVTDDHPTYAAAIDAEQPTTLSPEQRSHVAKVLG